MKKICGILLITALLLSVAGCGLGGTTLYLPEKVDIYSGDQLYSSVSFVYDEDGFLEELVISNGENAAHQSVTCDENGNVTSVTTEPTANILIGSAPVQTFTYSTRGNLLSTSLTVNSQVRQQTQWEYNTKNRILRAIQQIGSRQIAEYRYEYDDSGKLLTITWYTAGKPVSVASFTYDEKGKLLTEVLCNERETVLTSVEYRYEDGKTVASVSHSIGNTDPVLYTFDHAGNLIEVYAGENDSRNMKYVYTYKEVSVSADSPRKSYNPYPRLSETGLTTMWP